jgi:hypothetical protein
VVLVEGALRFDDFSHAWRIAGKRIQLLDSLREAGAAPGAALAGRRPVRGAKFIPGCRPRWRSRPGPCEVLVRYRRFGRACSRWAPTGRSPAA